MNASDERYDDNVPGDYYVNTECIACDTCTDVAPNFFELTLDFDHAFVSHQPSTEQDKAVCEKARLTCPVDAIILETAT